MGWMQRLAAVATPMRASADSAMTAYQRAFFAGDPLPDLWMSALSSAGVSVTPDLAMTLSAFYCGVTTIAYDLATLPFRCFKTRPDGGLDLVTASANSHEAGIATLAYKLQWQPNNIQTAVEFYASMVAQLKMRNVAYAEILPGPGGFMDQLLPRHPDRVRAQRLPSGAIRYALMEANGTARYVTQDEMFVIRDISLDGGITPMPLVGYAANAIGTGLAAERAAGKFYRTGMTAALLATYTGEADEEYESDLHKSISRYASGVENSFGLLVVPDNVQVKNLAIEPDKAQMMLAREWTVYEVARELRISPRKLMARGKGDGYASAYQDSIDHVVNCLRPTAVLIQQSTQRDLVLAKDTYRFVFHLGELLKGDPAQMGDFIEKLISSRAMTPSEVRMTYLDLNPDPHLDELSESDNRPGTPKSAPPAKGTGSAEAIGSVMHRLSGFVSAAAVRCVRRERAAVEKLAKKHANDPAAWQAGLREFYGEHAQFIAETMRLPMRIALGYTAEHGLLFEDRGARVIDGDAGTNWEREESYALAAIAIHHERAA